VWGGAECTVNRVGDTFFDQIERTGHAVRITDLDLFAELGIRALRYPVLWERTAPNGVARADWSWPDERLHRLRTLGIRPIVGLVHHGSGPQHTNLLDPAFAEGLAEFAAAVATRYPWIDSYTPVNEPLTTARFSGLYGHWYPHQRTDRAFVCALLNQCRAVSLAMQAIRAVNPAAQLVQTDDLGKVWSTPALHHQAHFENQRRWLSFDLLCGRVDPQHELWQYLRESGAAEAELLWFVEYPCPPDIIGINHYLSSERFLDEHQERYPVDVRGNNYADVLAARVCPDGAAGPYVLLREAWERYRIPIAITEAHNGCTREEQLRWLLEVWHAAQRLRDEGGDIRAVTIWSLIGAYDWHSLVTRMDDHYEPGVFDLRGPYPRPTALAGMVRELAAGRTPDHPLLDVPGWWHRPERHVYGFAVDAHGHAQPVVPSTAPRTYRREPRPIIISGATGTLGRAFARLCDSRGIPYRLLTRQELDITQPASIGAALDELHPWALVNAAGYVRVDDAEHDRAACYRANSDGPALLAAACARRGVNLLTFSSDLVFDGAQDRPYTESDPVAPQNVYGRSKAEAETRTLDALPAALVVRTSAFFGPWDQYNFITWVLRSLITGQSVVAANDTSISPTYVPDLVHTCLDLLIDGERGVWHLANVGAISWFDLARTVAERAGLDPTGIVGCSTSALGLSAPRPRYSVLGSERGLLLPSLDDALERYLQKWRVSVAAEPLMEQVV
jgi:dTDP-4-dehydrorhamnose reductase